jgi:hypothetical protein
VDVAAEYPTDAETDQTLKINIDCEVLEDDKGEDD